MLSHAIHAADGVGSQAAVAHVTGGPCCEFHFVVSGRVWMGICKGCTVDARVLFCGGSTEFVPGMFASGSVAHPAHRADKYIPGNRCYRCVRTTPQMTRFRDVQHAIIMATV